MTCDSIQSQSTSDDGFTITFSAQLTHLFRLRIWKCQIKQNLWAKSPKGINVNLSKFKRNCVFLSYLFTHVRFFPAATPICCRILLYDFLKPWLWIQNEPEHLNAPRVSNQTRSILTRSCGVLFRVSFWVFLFYFILFWNILQFEAVFVFVSIFSFDIFFLFFLCIKFK